MESHLKQAAGPSLAEKLTGLLTESDSTSLRIGTLMENLGAQGIGLLLIILSLPSALPVPAPGYSTPFGIAIFLLGFQLLMNHTTLWLPEFVRKRSIGTKMRQLILGKGIRLIVFSERFIRPRWQAVFSPATRILFVIVLMSMGALMVLPIPLTNTLPAIVVFVLALSLTQRDGVTATFAIILSGVAIVFYLTLITMIILYGQEGIEILKDFLRRESSV